MSLRRELEEIEKIKSMSIKNEIDRINTAKQDIKSAIEDKGVSVPDDAHIDEYSQYIQGLVNPSDVVTSVNGKKGDVTIYSTDVSDFDEAAKNAVSGDISDLQDKYNDLNNDIWEAGLGFEQRIGKIEEKIPTQASASNQLADKGFVNSSVQTATANFRGFWTTWDDVPTSQDLYPEDYAGSKIPTTNDYLVVADSTNYNEDNAIYYRSTWRFKYTGEWSRNGKSGWTAEYKVNEEPLTYEQLEALNSGITDEYVKQIEEISAVLSRLPRPTYYKLSGTPVTDMGGVGQKYPIAISNLTPQYPAPQVGDTVVFYTDSYTYIGTVTERQTSEIIVEVKVTMLGSAGSSGGGSEIQYYDTVIGSQEDFEAWYAQLDEGTYEGHSVLFLNGTYTRSDGKGLHLPDTLYTIKGIGSVIINISLQISNNIGISYDTPHADKSYLIENISLTCYNGDLALGFHQCTNLINCAVTATSTQAVGFSSCTNLINCTAIASGTYWAYAFSSCVNLTGCSGIARGGGGGGGTSASGPEVNSYTFYNCSICSNCRQDPDNHSSTATWGGTNTNVDPDTCPEWKGGKSYFCNFTINGARDDSSGYFSGVVNICFVAKVLSDGINVGTGTCNNNELSNFIYDNDIKNLIANGYVFGDQAKLYNIFKAQVSDYVLRCYLISSDGDSQSFPVYNTEDIFYEITEI